MRLYSFPPLFASCFYCTGPAQSICPLWYLSAFVMKELVWAQWHSVDTEWADDDIFMPQIILRSDYSSIKMIDLTWITPTRQRMSAQKNERVLSQQGRTVMCIKCDHLHGLAVSAEPYVLFGNVLWQPHRINPSRCAWIYLGNDHHKILCLSLNTVHARERKCCMTKQGGCVDKNTYCCPYIVFKS